VRGRGVRERGEGERGGGEKGGGGGASVLCNMSPLGGRGWC